MVDSTSSEEFDDVVMAEVTERKLVSVASKFVELRSAGLSSSSPGRAVMTTRCVRGRFGGPRNRVNSSVAWSLRWMSSMTTKPARSCRVRRAWR